MKALLSTLIILFIGIAPPATANQFGDPELGKLKSPSCLFCHGETGEAVSPSYPHLKGQNAQYLFQSMKDYQQRVRTGALSEMMRAQLSQLNDQDLRDIAAYYASQQ